MQLKAALITLRTSMWFIPMLMVAGAIFLAYGCISIDSASTADFARYYPQPFAGGADSIRMMLSAIATSMITVSGITFSLTISSLAQVSGQLTSRVLRNFVSSMTSKLVLGFFVGLFVFCLVVIRTIRIRDDAAGPFVPALSVFVSMALAMVGVGVLIYFIHYIAHSIQASTVVSSVTNETLATIDKIYPDRLAADAEEAFVCPTPVNRGQPAQSVLAGKNGYIQLIDEKKLAQLAIANNITLCVDAGTGDFVTQQTPLVTLIGFSRPIDKAITKAVSQAFSIRHTRTIDEEPAYGIRQLVDIALKALAPASDDTTTAVLVLDYLSAVLVCLVQRQLQPRPISGQFIPKHPSFGNLIDSALDQIRDTAGGNTVVLTRLLLLIQVVGRPAINQNRRAVLVRHARLVAEQANDLLRTNYQRSIVRQQLVKTLLILQQDVDSFGDLLKLI